MRYRIRSAAVDLGPGQARRHIAELTAAAELAAATGTDDVAALVAAAILAELATPPDGQ